MEQLEEEIMIELLLLQANIKTLFHDEGGFNTGLILLDTFKAMNEAIQKELFRIEFKYWSN